MSNFPQNLFEKTSQKVLWGVYLVAAVKIWDAILKDNYSNRACRIKGAGCSNPLVNILILTLISVVLSLILSGGKNKR